MASEREYVEKSRAGKFLMVFAFWLVLIIPYRAPNTPMLSMVIASLASLFRIIPLTKGVNLD